MRRNAKPVDLNDPSIPEAVRRVAAVCGKFIDPHKALDGRHARRDVTHAVRERGDVILLFKNGRWTTSDNDVRAVDIIPSRSYLPTRIVRSPQFAYRALVIFGLLTKEDVDAYDTWFRSRAKNEDRAEEIEALKREARRLGCSVVIDPPAVPSTDEA